MSGEGRAFEDEVRRVAEAVWGLQPGDCQPEWYRDDPVLSELDGIARLRDITHVIMATMSTKLDKVRSDIKKLNAAAKRESTRNLPVEKWLITERQLEAEHLAEAAKSGAKAITLANFRARFFNGRDYVSKRRTAAFGSVRNLRDGSISLSDDEYIELPMTMTVILPNGTVRSKHETPISINDLVDRVKSGQCTVLVALFGAGKSLTTREVFLRLAEDFLRSREYRTPIALNLREHWGARYGDEMLDRHARAIGFSPRENLTIAWRAGMSHLLLDGFDELGSQVIAQKSAKNFMREARRDALAPVRDLLGKHPSGTGILICGRDHYFDRPDEMAHALGLLGQEFGIVRLGEFTEEHAAEFLRRAGTTSALPDWLPRKPLILGYLAHQGLLDAVLQIDAARGFGYAWNNFLDLVCRREAEHDRAVMEPTTIRRVLERIACDARATPSGTGPISGFDLAEAYRLETGDVAGEGVLMQLQRLPGLTPREQDPSDRSFVDEDILAALQGSAVARAALENNADLASRRWLSGLSSDGVRMAAHILRENRFTPDMLVAAAIRTASFKTARPQDRQLAADYFAVAIELASESGVVDGQNLVLSEVDLALIDLDDQVVKNLAVVDSVIDTILVGPSIAESTVVIERCSIGEIKGVPSEEGLPASMFRDCVFDRFDDASTNAAVLKLSIPPSMKALLTVLRKLYLQAGGGRKVSALRRGLPGGPIFDSVDEVLRVLESEGVVAIVNGVAHPIRRQAARVHRILASAALSGDPVVRRLKPN